MPKSHFSQECSLKVMVFMPGRGKTIETGQRLNPHKESDFVQFGKTKSMPNKKANKKQFAFLFDLPLVVSLRIILCNYVQSLPILYFS